MQGMVIKVERKYLSIKIKKLEYQLSSLFDLKVCRGSSFFNNFKKVILQRMFSLKFSCKRIGTV